jgi:hypothetical protein
MFHNGSFSTTAFSPTAHRFGPVSTLLETVPYLIGKTRPHAESRIASIYCVPNVSGVSGTVTAQSPAAFTQVTRGSAIAITLGGAINDGFGRKRRRGLPIYSSRS